MISQSHNASNQIQKHKKSGIEIINHEPNDKIINQSSCNSINNFINVEENEMSFNIKSKIKNNIKNDVTSEEYNQKNNDEDVNVNDNSYDENLVPAYLNFRINLDKDKQHDLNNSKSLQKINEDSNNNSIDKSKAEVENKSNTLLKEKKIEEFYAKLKNQPLLDNSNYNKINKINQININSDNSNYKFVTKNKLNPKFEKFLNVSNEAQKEIKQTNNNKKNNPNKDSINYSMKENLFEKHKINETPKVEQDLKVSKKFNSQNNKINLMASNHESNKDLNSINNKINNNINYKLEEDKINSEINLRRKNRSVVKNNLSPKKLNDLTFKKDSNKISNSNLKNFHQRTSSQVPINVDINNKFQVSKIRNCGSSKNLQIKHQSNNNDNVNLLKNQNMNEVKKQVYNQNIEEINAIKKEQILESRRFLNQYLSKRNKDPKENCNHSSNNYSNTNNTWRKNIQINMEN